MHDHDDTNELPYLNDDDIKLLYAICERASESDETPFKALFAAYDAVFAEEQLDPQRDDPIFRYVMRVGESTRATSRERRSVDLLNHMRSVLQAIGITLENVDDSATDDYTTASADVQHKSPRTKKRSGRRVSFDDARYEEAWLSEHTESVNPAPLQGAPRSLLSIPPRRSRATGSSRRARSSSAQRTRTNTTAPSQPIENETDRTFSPTVDLDNPQSQLEDSADAFLSTSALRSARRVLHSWQDTAIRRIQSQDQALAVAVAHDRRALLEQALDLWRAALRGKRKQQREQQRIEKEWLRRDKRAQSVRGFMLMRKAFTHWGFRTEDEKLRVAIAHRHMLRFSYFKRWRAIAAENQMKARKILCRKYIARWREKTARTLLREEQANAHYEEALLRKCKAKWFWAFCSSRVEGWHKQGFQRRVFAKLKAASQLLQQQQHCAENFHGTHLLRKGFAALRDSLQCRQGDLATAYQHYDQNAALRALTLLQTESRLAPLSRSLQRTINANVLRKALRIWNLNLDLARQASEVDRRRILQTAWTDWNDALRCKALVQKTNERLLVENLYRWVLHERFRLFRRTVDGRIQSQVLSWWRSKVEEERDRLADAEIVFAERQRRRRLSYGMLRLNIAMHSREDAERAAIELAMSRALPKALDAWKEQTDHARRLAKWAADARFYFLCSSALKTWKERTTEHVANRRRDAYLHIRARLKTRLAMGCFSRLRTASESVRSMRVQAEQREQAKLADIGAAAFEHWREQSARHQDLNIHAQDIDRQKLQTATFAALRLRYADHERMEQQALDFQQETDLSILAGALRRVQWATFTATRKVESADALWARNRDQHIKQMLRHWAAQTAVRRSAALRDREAPARDDEEPDSPSLRPASRAASRSRARDYLLPSSPPTHDLLQSTPGYMRTPSRPRRAGRFRPLPTPAAFTPMAFESSYLVTTPAPIPPGDTSVFGDPPNRDDTEGLTPQITPFSRKLRAGGVGAGVSRPPTSALRGGDFRRSTQGGTNKSVRFAGSSRFRGADELHVKNS